MGLYYIATGTAVYSDPALNLPAVESDVSLISAALELAGYAKADCNPPLNPSGDDLRRLADWFGQRQPDDDVILYYVGHGMTDDQHYLVLNQESEFASLDLVRTFARNPRARRILLVLDTCESGAASLDLKERWKSFEDRFIRAQAFLTFVTSCRSRQEALTGKFTPAFAKALRNEDFQHGGRNQRRLLLPDVLNVLKLDLPSWQTTLAASFPDTSNFEAPFDFPNPRCDQKLPTGLDLESQRRFIERAAHWDDRIRYFTGRAEALAGIRAFLDRERGGALVVTGDPGSGKSSVLAHFVLDRSSIDLPIHAKGRDLDQMMEIVSNVTEIPLAPRSAGSDEVRARALARSVGNRGRRIAIAIDGLDEGVRPGEITRSLLAPLAESPYVWLLVGTRPDTGGKAERRFQGLGSLAEEIDLDSGRYFASGDIETYAQKRLLESGPYRGHKNLARKAARAVAGKAARTFLVAKLECDGLVKSGRAVDPSEIWQSRNPVDIKTAFDEYLSRFSGDGARRGVENVLRPLAFAFGQGLPRALWEQVARALSGEDITASVIQEVLQEAGAYVVESIEDERSVYRLFHEKFTQYFLESSDVADSHDRIVTALKPTDWRQGPSYTRRYLALHAQAASRLDELLEDPAFLVAAAPETLLRVVAQGKSDLAVRHGDLYSVAAHLMGPNLADRSASLALAATKFGYRELAAEFARFAAGGKWWPRAAQWQTPAPHFVIKSGHGAVRAVAVGLRQGRSVIVSGGDDGFIRLWDMETLERIGSPLDARAAIRKSILSNSITSIILGELDQRPVLIATNWEKTVRAWDLETLEPVNRPLPDAQVRKLSRVNGRYFALSSDWRTVEIHDLETWEPVVEQFHFTSSQISLGERQGQLVLLASVEDEIHIIDLKTRDVLGRLSEPGCNALATGIYRGRPAVVSGTTDREVRVWDLESFELLAGPLQGHETYVDAVALGERGQRDIVVSGSRDGSIRVWTPGGSKTRQRTGAENTYAVTELALAECGSKVRVVSGNAESFSVWDLESLEPCGVRVSGSDFSAIAVAQLGSLSVVVSGLPIGGVGLWEVSTKNRLGATNGGHTVRAVAAGILRGRSVAITSSNEDICIWDLDTLRPVGDPLRSKGAQTLAFYRDSGMPRIISAASATIRLWDLETLESVGPPMTGHESIIYQFATGQLQGKPIAVSVSFDETVRVWDLQSFQPLGDPLRGHQLGVHAVAIGGWNGRQVIFSGGIDGTIRAWDLETHASLATIHLDSWIFALQVHGTLVVAGCANGLAVIELR